MCEETVASSVHGLRQLEEMSLDGEEDRRVLLSPCLLLEAGGAALFWVTQSHGHGLMARPL